MNVRRRPNPGDPTLTEAQTQRLAALVAGRLLEMANPKVRVPLPEEYRVQRHWAPNDYYDLSVDVDVGFSTITIRSPSNDIVHLDVDDLDLQTYSKSIFMHVFLARSDCAGAEELEEMHAICSQKIARDRSGLQLVSVRYAPADLHRPARLVGRPKWVWLCLLDDALELGTELITGRTARRLREELQRVGAEQARRSRARDRLAKRGAILEVEAVAERAIIRAGRSVGDVARSIYEQRGFAVNGWQSVVLWGDPAKHYVGVRVHRGRITLEMELPELTWTSGNELILPQGLPETVLNGLAGRYLRDLVEHPALPEEEIIDGFRKTGPDRTHVRIRSNPRPIFKEELR